MLVPTYLWQYIGIDFVGPLPKSTNCMGDYHMICVIIDFFNLNGALGPYKTDLLCNQHCRVNV